jgi:hypothetical protein
MVFIPFTGTVGAAGCGGPSLHIIRGGAITTASLSLSLSLSPFVYLSSHLRGVGARMRARRTEGRSSSDSIRAKTRTRLHRHVRGYGRNRDSKMIARAYRSPRLFSVKPSDSATLRLVKFLGGLLRDHGCESRSNVSISSDGEFIFRPSKHVLDSRVHGEGGGCVRGGGKA